jgi:polyketide synthase 5
MTLDLVGRLPTNLGKSRSGTRKFLAELDKLPRRTIDADRLLTVYGLNSLSSQELRACVEAETGIRITATDINTTVRDLAELLYEKLLPAGSAPAPSGTSD